MNIIEHPKTVEGRFRQGMLWQEQRMARVDALFADWPEEERRELMAMVVGTYLSDLHPQDRPDNLIQMIKQAWRFAGLFDAGKISDIPEWNKDHD